jgi:hypothetical protein
MNSSNYAVSFNGSGILAKDWTFNTSTNANLIPTFGQKYLVTTSGPSYTLSTEYLFNSLYDPILTYISGGATGTLPVQVVFGGQSGLFYLNNYSFNIQGMNSLTCAAGLVSFRAPSGQAEYASSYAHSGFNEILTNAANIFLEVEGANFRCNSFDYSFSAQIAPKYMIGSGFPYEIAFLGSNEQISLSLWTGFMPSFYGDMSTNLFNGRASIVIRNDDKSNLTREFRLPLSGFLLQSYENNLRVNDIVRYNFSMVKIR